jgi:hypothetical protein
MFRRHEGVTGAGVTGIVGVVAGVVETVGVVAGVAAVLDPGAAAELGVPGVVRDASMHSQIPTESIFQ